jgi:hypothetical protein
MGKGARKKKKERERMNEARNNLKSYALSYSSRHMTLHSMNYAFAFT